MDSNFDQTTQERAVLVGLNADCFTKEQTATEETLEELEALLETAGGFCTGKVLQNRHTPDSHSFIGEGKALEVKMLAEATASTMVIFDNELSPGNIRALEEIIGVTVLDRSALILDIFAQRAKTKEGRLQVELAQYKYLLPRLSGMGASLSRQGGGIGTRGPGETKLESDRRHIRERINRLEQELEQVRKVRGVQRERRMKNSVPVVAIVGYTNAGKSTLLNQLTGAGIPANNRLFDTLDTTTRTLEALSTTSVKIFALLYFPCISIIPRFSPYSMQCLPYWEEIPLPVAPATAVPWAIGPFWAGFASIIPQPQRGEGSLARRHAAAASLGRGTGY